MVALRQLLQCICIQNEPQSAACIAALRSSQLTHVQFKAPASHASSSDPDARLQSTDGQVPVQWCVQQHGLTASLLAAVDDSSLVLG